MKTPASVAADISRTKALGLSNRQYEYLVRRIEADPREEDRLWAMSPKEIREEIRDALASTPPPARK